MTSRRWVGAFVCALLATGGAGVLHAELVRSAENGRIWQVNLAPDEPIRWAWITGADTAKLTVSNQCTQTETEYVVATNGALFGSLALNVPAEPLEQVYTVWIEQYYRHGQANEKRLSSESARIAYLPGIHGTAIDVMSAKHVRQAENPAVFAYDSAWASASAAATEASVAWNPADGAAGARALEGTSGYDTVALEPFKNTNLTLSFDDTPCWSADVLNGTFGLMLLFR